MNGKNIITLWLAIIVVILTAIIVAYNAYNLEQVTGHKVGPIIIHGYTYKFKFVTTQKDSLNCVYLALPGTTTNISTKSAMELETIKNSPKVTLYGKKKGKKFIIHRILG